MTSNLGSAYIQSQFEKINDENREVVIERDEERGNVHVEKNDTTGVSEPYR